MDQTIRQFKFPWTRTIHIRELLPIIYEAAGSSYNLLPFQLLALAKLVLTTAKNIHLQNTDFLQDNVDNILQAFDKIFERITKTKFETSDGLEAFLDFVWELYDEGILDLKGTSVPGKLMLISPSHLDGALNAALGASDPSTLLPLCQKNSGVFTKIMMLLHSMCEGNGESNNRESIMCFTKDFVSLLKSSVETEDYFDLYPTYFYTILHFEKAVFDRDPALFQNSDISQGLLSLINELYRQCEENKDESLLSFVEFLISINPTILNVIKLSQENNVMCYKRWPYLWTNLKMKENNMSD